MNSKEFLDKLYDACDKELLYEQCGILDAYELFEGIKKDLDRLEEQQNYIQYLYDENQKLNKFIDSLTGGIK